MKNIKKVIIFGGAGFIGVNLSLSALEQGMQVVVVDNCSRKGSHLNLAFLQQQYPAASLAIIREDIRNFEAMRQVFTQHADTDAIFHLAGQVAVTTSVQDPREDFESNLLGTLNILEAMRLHHISAPILFASTNKVYGNLTDIRVRETADRYELQDFPDGIAETCQLDFHSPYGCSKGGADQYVLDYARIFGLHTIVFRQSCIYGYRQYGIEDQGWVAWFTIASLFDLPITIYGNGKQVRDVLFIDDLIRAYWAAIQHIDVTHGQAYNIGGNHYQMSLLELLRYLETIFSKTLTVSYTLARPGDQQIFVADIRKARRDFGWEPRIDVQQGVNLLARWVKESKSLFIQAGIIKE